MYDYDFHSYSIKRRRSKQKIVFSFFGVVALSSLLFWFITGINHPNNERHQNVLSAVDATDEDVNSKLDPIIKQALLGAEGSYSVVIKNLKTDEAYSLNQHRVYESGSLYKLWVMAAVFEKIQAGKLKESDTIVGDVANLNKKFDISDDEAELKDGEVNFTVGSALTQMITISHNYAALTLTDKIGLAAVRTFLADHGLNESKVGGENQSPTTTAYDTGLFLDKLAKGELANEQYTTAMLDLLKGQQLNGKLPKYLPESVVVGHKTGELGLFSHDAGIVYTPNSNYIIVVLTKSDYPPDAEERIANVSRAVYEYFLR